MLCIRVILKPGVLAERQKILNGDYSGNSSVLSERVLAIGEIKTFKS